MFSLIPLPVKIGAVLLLLAGIAGLGYSKGEQSVQDKWDDQKAADAAKVSLVKDQSKTISEVIDTRHVRADIKIRTVYKTITKEVPVYVDKVSDSACTVPNGFVLVHDAAAIGALPKAPGVTDGAASGIELSTVAETITENYGTYAEIRQRLIDLQDWIKQQEAIGGSDSAH